MSAGTMQSVFMDSLHRSELFTDQEYHDLTYLIQSAGLHPGDNKGVASWCVQQGYLTRFQAKQLLAGKWRNFIINHKYKVLESLGQGGMGAVFRCEHLTLHKEVALKVLPTELTQNPAALQRFLREAQALAALDHPNIVQAHDVDEEKGQYFIIMACVEGKTLQDLVRKNGPLPAGQAADYIAQACRGLQHAHEGGWVHRDLKPGNLILDQGGTVKIMDFGLARLASAEGSVTRQFEDCNVLGSPDYISPEQAMNRPDIDIRADIYSLGATLYFLLSGRAPFEGEPLLQKLLAHQMREPEEVSIFRSDIPAGLASLLKRMMAKKPEDRFTTPQEVEAALRPFLRSVPPEHAPSTANRARSGKTQRVPRVEDAALSAPPADVLDAPAPVIVADLAPPPEEGGDTPFGLSPALKRWLLLGTAATVSLVLGVMLLMWLLSPADRTARLARADELGRGQQWKGAAAIYAELLKDAAPDSTEYTEIHRRARSWEAVAIHLLEHFPNDAEFNRAAAKYYLKQNKHEQALACLERVLSSDVGNPALWHDLAGALVLQRNWRKAADCLERASRGKPDNPEWSRDRGFVYAAMNDWENYRRVCKETLERFGSKDKPWGNRIEVAYTFGQGSNPAPLLDDVLRLAKEMTEESPSDTNHLFRYGVALYRAGRWQEAYDTLKIAQGDETKPGYEPHRCEPALAMVLVRLGRQDEARRILADHRKWYEAEAAKKTKTPFVPVLDRWWDSLALENLRLEAETIVEGKPRL